MAAFIALLAAATRWVISKTKHEYVKSLEQRFSDSVTTAVKATEQAVLTAVRLPDGSVPEDAGARAKEAAMASVRSYWGAKGLAELEKVLGMGSPEPIDATINREVEAKVLDLKSPPLVVAVPATTEKV
jgi:tRNA U54 and U55 pseudouridine synthase Pus10